MPRRLLLLLVLGTATLPFGASLALADDGPTRLLSASGLRPPETVERLVARGVQKVLLTVRGYGSTPGERVYWDPLVASLPDHRHLDLGTDAGTYHTRGRLAESGDALRREIQRLVREEDVASVTIVSVSQGGVVTDEAFRSGLSARDNVAGWVTIASPLNGSTVARIVRDAGRAAEALGARRELAELIAPLGGRLDDPAMVDLAARRSFSAPREVPTTQFWALTDELVFDRDARIDGARYVRTLTPTLLTGVPAHGGQLSDARTRRMVATAARGERVVEDAVEGSLAAALAVPTDLLRETIFVCLAVVFVSAAAALAVAKHVFGTLRWSRG